MTVSLIGGSLICIAFGLKIGWKYGRLSGQQDALNRLILVKNSEMWEAAHYIAVDYTEKKT